MNDPTLFCPHCKTEIKLTESLAAPLLESTRAHYEKVISDKEMSYSNREAALKKKEIELINSKHAIEEEIAARLDSERSKIADQEAKKAKLALTDEIARTKDFSAALEQRVKDQDAKLDEARKNELDLRKERQSLLEQKDMFELEKQKAIDAERAIIRESAQKDADEQSRLKLAERDKTISDLQVKLQDALRKAEQGSQQLQGEVQELEIEAQLKNKFPTDIIEPVPKGEFGGDSIHRVLNHLGKQCGTILWESKRTRNWSDGWLAKLKDNQRTAKAELAIIVSTALPKGTETFDLIDGIWVTNPQVAISLAYALRFGLIELFNNRTASEGQQSKMELVYQYLTGPQFRHRIQATIEKVDEMQEDLTKERNAITKTWAKREKQIQGILDSTAGLFGDLQGIAGKTILEVEGLSLKLIGDSEAITR